MKTIGKPGCFREKWVKCRWSLSFFFLIALSIPPPAHTTTPPPQVNPTTPLPPTSGSLLQQQTPIPEQADGPFQVWKEKDKYFLVIAVDQTGVKGTDLDFARVDGREVADTLANLGYKPLLENARLLTGEQTNRDNVISALEGLKDLVPPATVIVYYSGHGITGEQEPNLWLQLSGQDKMGSRHGVTLSEVVKTPRMVGYNGELIVILDAGYSGRATLSETLTLKDLGEKTIIFSSSIKKQNSQTIQLPEGKKSAFTHTLLNALGSQWATADGNRDGILQFSELNNFIRVQLHSHFQNKDIPELMKPKLIRPQHEEFFIAYQRAQVQQWFTDDRQVLQISALERALTPSISRGESLAKTSSPKLGVPKQAQALAQQISSKTNDLYAKGLLALAEGRLDEARTLLAQAETKEKTHKHKLAKIHLAGGRTETYAGQFNKAIFWYKKTLALQPPEEAKLLNEFGLVWVKAGLYEEALPFLEQGLKLREKTLDPMDPSLAVSLNNLAGLYHNQGKYAEAEPIYQRSFDIMRRRFGLKHRQTRTVLNNYLIMLEKSGQKDKARRISEEYQQAIRTQSLP